MQLFVIKMKTKSRTKENCALDIFKLGIDYLVSLEGFVSSALWPIFERWKISKKGAYTLPLIGGHATTILVIHERR